MRGKNIEKQPTIKCGKHIAEHADLSGSEFHNVNLAGADFNNVNMSKAKFHDINFSDVTFTAAQIGGTLFKHIGPPPCKKGGQERQRPVTFEEAMLCDSTFRRVDMSNVKIIDCNIAGATIDGIRITDMIEAYRKLKG